VGEELVAQALARACPPDDAGDVYDPQGGGDDLLGLDELVDDGQAFVGDGHDPDIGLDGGEGVVGGQRPGGGEGVEDGALADVREPDDSCFHKGREYTRAVPLGEQLRRIRRIEFPAPFVFGTPIGYPRQPDNHREHGGHRGHRE
jgi:hypothetical protein